MPLWLLCLYHHHYHCVCQRLCRSGTAHFCAASRQTKTPSSPAADLKKATFILCNTSWPLFIYISTIVGTLSEALWYWSIRGWGVGGGGERLTGLIKVSRQRSHVIMVVFDCARWSGLSVFLSLSARACVCVPARACVSRNITYYFGHPKPSGKLALSLDLTHEDINQKYNCTAAPYLTAL